MLRYVAWIWDASDEASNAEAGTFALHFETSGAPWRRAFRRPGIDVFVTGCKPRTDEVYELSNTGVILGKLFARSDEGSQEAPIQVPDEEVSRIMTRQGRDLIARYWGRYVAFLCDTGSRRIRVLRAPCGTLPCLRVPVGKLHCYCSWIDDLAPLGVDRWSVSWPVLCALLSGALPDLRQTAVSGLSQVLGGECVSHNGLEIEHTWYWDPIDSDEIEVDLEGAAQLLNKRVVDCIRAWRGCYGKIVQTLSGGLDSSIVAVSQVLFAPQAAAFLNYYLPDSDSEERKFARLIATQLGVELTEWQHDPSLSLKGLLQMRRQPMPAICLHSLEFSQREAEFCAEKGATAIWGGHGGDQAFYTGAGAPCAASYLARHAHGPSACRVILDAAYRDGRSVRDVLRAIRQQKEAPFSILLGMQLGRYRALMEPDVLEQLRRVQPVWLHPLLRHHKDADPARLVHAEQALPADDYFDTFCGPNYPDRISPLLSQPVVELCLSFPRDLLISGGWTRAIARRAFKSALPCEIVMRREKGGVRELFREVLHRQTENRSGALRKSRTKSGER